MGYADVVATLALVLVVGGGAAVAAGTVPKNSVVSASVKNGSLTGKDVKNSSLTGADVAESTFVLPDGSIGSAQIADESIVAGDVATGSIGSSQVSDNSLTAADLAPDSVDFSELASNSIDGTNIINWTMTTGDIARVAGTFSLNYPSVGANSCVGVNVDLSAFGAFDPQDPAFVMADTAWGGPVSLNVEGTGTTSFIALKACNPTAGAVDPDGAGGGSYRFVVFNAV